MSPQPGLLVPHFEKVDLSSTIAQFFDNGRHRATLFVPFADRETGRTLCVIGQNPSAANEQQADKTVRYLEELIYRNCPWYEALLVLNLYSRVDFNKSATGKPLHTQCARIFNDAIGENEEFLLVHGQLKNQGIYKFPQRAMEVEVALASKTVFKIDIGTDYPPHPRNQRLCYSNFHVNLVRVNGFGL